MSYDPERITLFARTDARGQNVPFGIKAKDRTKHIYVIGKTGMGKSTLLENMAVQDMRNGEGLAFIDPHGQTAETLLNYVPEDRVEDVLYFAPFDMGHPVSFNVMEDVGADKRHLVVSGLMSVFEKIWVDAWSARMAYILQNTLMALLEYPDSTLLGVNRVLSDKDYRKAVVDNIKDPSVRSFWVDEFAKYNERYMQEAGDAIKNKIGQFTGNPLIRNIIGQPKSSFDIRKIMDEKKILIMNLSKGLVGESNANLLGSMLTTRIYLAAMSRADLSVEQMKTMPNFYFYVDEFQSFANATFANILSEARKYKLNLTIAHQYVEQMEEEVKNAVFGNVGTIISFRVGPLDAELLEQIFTPHFTAADIVNLGFAQIYLSLMIDGVGSAPFSATTLPPIESAKVSCKDMVVASSRQKFGQPRAEVEQMINKWHEPLMPARHKESTGQTARSNQSGGNNRSNNNGHNQGGSNRRPEKGGGRPDHGSTRPVQDNNRERNTKSAPRDSQSQSAAPQLNELRAVLRSIAGNDTTKETQSTDTPTKSNPKALAKKVDAPKSVSPQRPAKEMNKSSIKTADSSLRNALANVLKENTTPPPTKTSSSDAPVTTSRSKDPSTVEDKTKISPQDTAEASSASELPSVNDDPLSPKKLERMMRITTSDQTPFK